MTKHISILIPAGHTSLVNIAGSHQIFNQVNGFLASQVKDPLFQVELVGLSIPTEQTHGLFSVKPTRLVSDIEKTVKVEAAKRSLEATHKNVNEVMFEVGYNDSKAFRSTFKKVTGMSPVDYKKKFNKLTAAL